MGDFWVRVHDLMSRASVCYAEVHRLEAHRQVRFSKIHVVVAM